MITVASALRARGTRAQGAPTQGTRARDIRAQDIRVRAARFAAVAGIAVVTLTACGQSEGQGPGDDAADSAQQAEASQAAGDELDLPEGWQYVAGEFEPVDATAEPDLPATVTDGAGAQVEVTDVERIIAAGDGISSTLGALGLGENVYAAPEESTAAEGIAAEEHFQFNKDTGTEGLLAMDGSLFIGDNVARHEDVAAQFRDAGTDAVVIDDQTGQAEKLKAVAEYVGLPEAGEELAASLEADVEQARSIVSEEDLGELRVLQVTATGAGGQNAVAGVGVPGTEMVEDLGMVSVGVESGLRGFSREFSNEGILAADPDIIVIAESDYEKWGGEEGLWEAFPTLRDTPAGQQGDVLVMPDAQLRYSSPELGAGAKALAETVAGLA